MFLEQSPLLSLRMTRLVQRKKVKTLIDAGITSSTEISRRTRIPIRTVFRIKSMVREGKSLQHKTVSGRPKVITYSQKQSIIRTLNCYPKMSTCFLHANLSSSSSQAPHPSRLTIKRLACGFDFRSPIIGPFITDETAKNRVEWCKIHKKREWENIFFTDECSIWLNRGTVGIWTKSQENPISKVQRHTPKLHVWGYFIQRYHNSKDFFVNFTSKMYTKRTKVFQHLILSHTNNTKMGLFMKRVTSKRYGNS